MSQRGVWVGAAVATIALGAQGAQAATCSGGLGEICVTDTVTWNGGTSSAAVSDPLGAATAISSYSPTASFFVGDAFNPGPIAQDFPSPGVAKESNGNAGQWNFYDNYVFTLNPGATVQSALVSFSNGFTGISDLEARIFKLGPSVGTNGDYDSLAPSDLGNPPTNGTSVVDSWTSGGNNAVGIYQVSLNQHAFSTGTYVLQIRGEVQPGTGSGPSGSYGGALSLTPLSPVPLPATLPLLLGGLGLLGGLARRRPAV